VDSSPAVVGGKVYVGSEDNSVYCLDVDTGSKIWKYKTGGCVWSSPAVADGKVYISVMVTFSRISRGVPRGASLSITAFTISTTSGSALP
jgi:outer membrane protein assembly factor BamB